VFERAKTFHALDRAATVIGTLNTTICNIYFQERRKQNSPGQLSQYSCGRTVENRLPSNQQIQGPISATAGFYIYRSLLQSYQARTLHNPEVQDTKAWFVWTVILLLLHMYRTYSDSNKYYICWEEALWVSHRCTRCKLKTL
jgi:hypothetical protein